VWLILLPLRLIGIAVEGVFRLLAAWVWGQPCTSCIIE